MTSILSPASSAAAGPSPSSLSTTHPFTCNTCQVAFRSSEQQRAHMHTDWHRYNLKRRVTSLPPLASEVFAEKVLHIQATSRLERERASFEKQCKPCNKTYYSENAYTNHVGSQRHKQNVAAHALGITRRAEADKDETGSVISSTFSLGTAVEDEAVKVPNGGVDVVPEETEEERAAADREFAEVIAGLKIAAKDAPVATVQNETPKLESAKGPVEDEKEPEPLPLEQCLFCTYVSPTLVLNVSHMAKAHGLFIPEREYLVDLPGLIRYLGEKISHLNICIWCGKMKGGLEGIRTHMRDVGHCKIAFETEDEQLELGEFYDFRSTYDDYNEVDSEDEDVENSKSRKRGGIKPTKAGKEAEFKAEGSDGDQDDAGWETDSSASSLDSVELCAVPLDHHTRSPLSQDGNAPVKHHKEDGWHSRAHSHAHTTAVYHTEYELHLPSGRSVGHRSLARYYRQNLSHPLSERIARQRAVSKTLYPENVSNDDDYYSDVEDGEEVVTPRRTRNEGVGRELTRRERRDLFFGRMPEEVVRLLVGTRERGTGTLTTRGEAGMLGVTVQKRREVRDAERRGRRMEQRERRNYEWGVEKRGNLQKHYRDPLLQ